MQTVQITEFHRPNAPAQMLDKGFISFVYTKCNWNVM